MKYFISHLISGLQKNYSHFKTRLQVRQNLDILKLDGMINSKIFLQQTKYFYSQSNASPESF